MASSRDLFGNFERMRREVDELFGDRSAWEPAVDVFYVGDPPRAVVHAELPGVDPDHVTIEVRGRELVLGGRRAAPPGAERLYQQLEIGRGAFRRVIPLGADVVADEAAASYRDGILEITLPLHRGGSRRRRVPVREKGRS